MTPNANDACDLGRLTRLVGNALSQREENALTLHLDACSTCRQRLDELTASPAEWERIRALGRRGDSAHGQAQEEGGLYQSRPLSFLGPTDDPAMLGRLGPYEAIGVVGEGGMGIVLKVFDRALNRNVAVKVLAPQLAAAAAARRRFAREAQAAAAVVHEHVIAIHAVDEFNGFPYLVMPYISGRSVQQRIESTGPLTVTEILRIGAQTAAGLAAAHAQGLIHRDIKPANILLENGVERVLITDFGLARAVDDATLTCSGVVAGTPQYMAPEQAQGGSIDHRADLFSLGSVLYTMCAGRPPFRAQTTMAVLRRICEDRPRPIGELNPEIPTWLAEIIGRLHAKDPAERFQAADDVAEILGRCLAHVQNPSACPLPRELASTRAGRLLRSYRSGRGWNSRRSLAALSVLLGVGGAAYWSSRPRPKDNSDPPAAASATFESFDSAAVDLGDWDADVARLRRSVHALGEPGFEVPDEQWNDAQAIPELRDRIQSLDEAQTQSSF